MVHELLVPGAEVGRSEYFVGLPVQDDVIHVRNVVLPAFWDGKIQGAVGDVVEGVVIFHGAEGANHVPLLPEIRKEQLVHLGVPEEREKPQADGVAHAGFAGIEGVVETVHGGEHLGGVLTENQAGLGNLHAVGAPDEEFFPQLLLDGVQLMRQRRLRDEQVACSVRQVLVFRNGKNGLQMFNFHFSNNPL